MKILVTNQIKQMIGQAPVRKIDLVVKKVSENANKVNANEE